MGSLPNNPEEGEPSDEAKGEPAPAEPEAPPSEPPSQPPSEPDPTALVSETERVPSEAEIVGGERAVTPLPSLDELTPRHTAYVRGLVSKLGVTPSHEHEDLVQEVLIQAHRSRDSPLEPRALLFGITRHVVYRWIARREHDRETIAATRDEDAEAAGYPSAEDQWQAAQRARAVHEALEGLPDIFREVFIRCELDELPMPQVARELRIPINTGYTRLHLARARFSDAMRRYFARHRLKNDDLAIPIAPFAVLEGLERADGAAPAAEPKAAPTASGSLGPASGWLAKWPIFAGGFAVAGTAAVILYAWPHPPQKAPVAPTAEVKPEPALTIGETQAPTTAAPAPTTTASASDTLLQVHGEPLEDPEKPFEAFPTPGGSGQAHVRSEGTWARQIVGDAATGNRTEAIRGAAAFRETYPKSTYLPQIEEALAKPR